MLIPVVFAQIRRYQTDTIYILSVLLRLVQAFLIFTSLGFRRVKVIKQPVRLAFVSIVHLFQWANDAAN